MTTKNLTKSQVSLLSLLGSSLCFALVTCGVKLLASYGWQSTFVTWGRFLFGSLILSAWFLYKKQLPKANKSSWVLFRAFSNTLAVSLFYLSVYYTSLAKANLLNMTYPLFVAFFAPLLLKEKTSARTTLAIAISCVGVFTILGISKADWQLGDIYGLLCGAVASLSIISLRGARKNDSSDTILFYVMSVGALALLPFIQLPETSSLSEWGLFGLCSFGGVLGQYFLTMAYKNVGALEGALASSSRVIFSALFGFWFFQEAVGFRFALGSSLIIFGIYYQQTKKRAPTPS